MLGQSFVVVSISLAVGLVALFGPAGISANGDESREGQFDPWAAIDNHLDHFENSGTFPSFEDVEPLLIDWINRLRTPSLQEPFDAREVQSLLEALTKLERFKTMIDEKICDQNSIEFRDALTDTISPYSNLEIILGEWVKKHWTICLQVLDEEHSRIAEIWNGHLEHTKLEKRLNWFFGTVTHQQIKKDRNEDGPEIDFGLDPATKLLSSKFRTDFELYITKSRYFELFDNLPAEIAYDTVNKLASRERGADSLVEGGRIQRIDGKIMANPEQAKELFEKFIRRSCEEYVNFWGPNWFSTTKFDQKLVEKPHRYELVRSRISHPFYITLLFYKSCEGLINNTNIYEQLLKQIGEIATKSAAAARAEAIEKLRTYRGLRIKTRRSF